ncbi:hypothetical protein BDV96DRAFT_663185 [Lophiotrema nucula]|uniref:Uncharacterized protein n=1 Tax=Lophiotrema nucula TaxID=690887 RepID=A0A6A5ZV41_9PLEO|nr:hypothetical protein BDV96DRAFT_663185 [Lophiotrema nucula]
MRVSFVLALLLAVIATAGSIANLQRRLENALGWNTTDTTSIDPIHEHFALAASSKNGCHTKGDNIGLPCEFRNYETMQTAATLFCEMFDNSGAGFVVPTGQFYKARISQVPCGNSVCDFWGNIKVDREKENHDIGSGWNWIDTKRCLEHFDDIWSLCRGNGGWW